MVMKAASALLLERGHEAPKLGRSPSKDADKIHQKRTEANEIEANPGDPLKRPVVYLRPTDEVSISEIQAEPATVSAQFFDYMTHIATARWDPWRIWFCVIKFPRSANRGTPFRK
jgi:hypothetical protein